MKNQKLKIISLFIVLFIILGGFTMSINAQTKTTINVYLIAGQSNAVGYGVDTNNQIAISDARFRNGFDNVLYYGEQERVSGELVNENFQPVKLGLGQAYNSSGAEIGIASALKDTDTMNAVIKCAWGATHLYPDTLYDISYQQGTWTSPSYIRNKQIDTSTNQQIGRMYKWFIQTVQNGLKKLEKQGYNPVIKGMWWMQGEAEMHHQNMANSYEELITTLISDIRTDLTKITRSDYSEMPFIFGLPSWNASHANPPTYQEQIRKTLQKVSIDTQNVDYIDCRGLIQHDMWHFDALGQIAIGEQFIQKLQHLNAENLQNFQENIATLENSSIRFESPAGMRFKAVITNYAPQHNYQYGMLMFPADYLDKYQLYGQYHQALENLNINVIDLTCNVQEGDCDSDGYLEHFIQGSITNIKYQNINRDFVGIGYIKDQNNNFLYTSSYEKSNLANIASREIIDLKATDAKYPQLMNYLDAGVNQVNNINQSDAYEPSGFTFTAKNNLEINVGYNQEPTQINVVQSPNMKYYVRYTSANEDIAAVDENGFITGKKVGSTTVLIECAGQTKTINITVTYPKINDIVLDGIRDEKYGKFEDVVLMDDNRSYNISAKKTPNGVLIYSQGVFNTSLIDRSSSNWYNNTNFEFKLNGGEQSYVTVKGESYGVTQFYMNVEKQNNKYVHTIELFVDKSLITNWNNKDVVLNYAWSTPSENAAILSDILDYQYQFEWGNYTTWHSYQRLGGISTGFNPLVSNLFISNDGLTQALPTNNDLNIDGCLTSEEIQKMGPAHLNVNNGAGTETQVYATVENGDIYMAFKIQHEEWSSQNKSEWWKNDNIEMYINGQHIVIIFLNGKLMLPYQISDGKATTNFENGKNITTLELLIKGDANIYKFIVNANGLGFGWNNLLWRENQTTGYLSNKGIYDTNDFITIDDNIILDGLYNEDIWKQTTTNLTTKANNAYLSIVGYKLQKGLLFGVTIRHTRSPLVSLDNSNNWYSFMNVEFRINGLDKQFIATCKNQSSHSTFSYCKTIQEGYEYLSTFEIFIPYSEINATYETSEIPFTINGWFESGWCWIWNTHNWNDTHKLTTEGISRL